MQGNSLRRFFFILVLITGANIYAFAQGNNSIKGFVYEAATGEPVMFSNVYLKGTTIGGSTDENGYFNIICISDG